jgi:hypothetical protein
LVLGADRELRLLMGRFDADIVATWAIGLSLCVLFWAFVIWMIIEWIS